MTEKDNARTKKWQQEHKKKCPFCEKEIYYRSKTCRDCFERNRIGEEIKNMSIGAFRIKSKNKGTHPSWLYAEVRNFARSWNKELRKLPCRVCGYNKHVELCHIKPLNKFDDSDLLKEINSPNNIVVLCPNCHWEFDNGILIL